jgi:hypothetical protein
MGKAKIKTSGKSRRPQSRTKTPARHRAPRLPKGQPTFFELPDGRKISYLSRPIEELFGVLGRPPAGRSLRVEEIDDIVAKAVVERRLGKK